MSEFFDFLEYDDILADVDGDGIPDIHQHGLTHHYSDVVPDGVNEAFVDKDGDGIPDGVDQHIDLDGSGLHYTLWLDSGADGMNDWIDPYASTTGTGLSAEMKHYIEHMNPHL